MGFFLRKSVRVGPLRFNLSKSGIGVSTGIRGLRVGMGPRGNYVHMGLGGLYYRTTLRPDPASEAGLRPTASPIPGESISVGPMEAIESSSTLRMVDSSSTTLLEELNSKRSRIRIWPFVAFLAGAFVVLLLVMKMTAWIVVPLAILLAGGVFAAYMVDQLTKTVVILYDFDSEMAAAFERLHQIASQIGACAGAWQIDARGNVHDPKYHAGAGQVVTRSRISAGEASPPYVTTNVPIFGIRMRALTLYFFPDRALVYGASGVGAVSYDDLGIVINERQFIEEGTVPHDAKVVGRTWRYVNRKGGPDRRFSDNREIPICLYEELWFNTPSGLNELIQVSRVGIGEALSASIQVIADLSVRAAAQPKMPTGRVPSFGSSPEAHAGAHETAKSMRVPDELLNSILNALCCVMVADGRASRSEKLCIQKMMTDAGSLWDEPEIELRIDSFIDRIGRGGYRRVLATCLEEIPRFKALGGKDFLLDNLDKLVATDGQATDRELHLCSHIRALLQ